MRGAISTQKISQNGLFGKVRKVSAALLLGALCAGPAMAETTGDRDPWEPMNRAIFSFNDTADTYILKPVAQGYDAVMPSFGRAGVNNFFGNLLDVNGALNALLQGEFAGLGINTSRVVINSTLGFFGFFDVATDMGVYRYQTDFGHTLATWGLPMGPYVVVPLLGPRTVRSAVGTGVDGYASPLGQINDNDAEWGLRALDLVDIRAGLLDVEQVVSGDRYVFFRDAYLQQREVLINGGPAPDNFSEFEEGWDDDL